MSLGDLSHSTPGLGLPVPSVLAAPGSALSLHHAQRRDRGGFLCAAGRRQGPGPRWGGAAPQGALTGQRPAASGGPGPTSMSPGLALRQWPRRSPT